MVFENVFANLLNTYLSSFIDDVSSNQLKLGAWKGKFELKNLSVKENALDSLDLPFKVVHGRIGVLSASIPWSSLYTSPVILNLTNVFVNAVPNVESTFDSEKEDKQADIAKQRLLESIEEAVKKSKEQVAKQANQDDFVTKLAAQIVKNVQIRITNLHICYEDSFSNPSKPFSAGITFERVVFETQTADAADATDIKYFPNKPDAIIYKLVSLEKLALYWNVLPPHRAHTAFISNQDSEVRDDLLLDGIATTDKKPSYLNYVLEPITFTTNAMINRKPEDDEFRIPMIDLGIILDSFNLCFKRTQFESLLQLLDSIGRMRAAAPYRRWRPTVPVHGNARRWWKFTYTAIVETTIKKNAVEWSWVHMKKHRALLREYKEAYVKKLCYPKNKQYAEAADQLEKQLNVVNIVLVRRQAESEATQRESPEKKAKKEKKSGGWFSWSSWVGGADEAEEAVEPQVIGDLKKEMTTDEKEKLYEAIGYGEGETISDFPENFAAHLLNFRLGAINFIIMDDIKGKSIVDMSLQKVVSHVSYRPSSNGLMFNTSIGTLQVLGIDNRPLLRDHSTNGPYGKILELTVDMNLIEQPDNDYSVKVKAKGLRFVYDAATINSVVEMFTKPSDLNLKQFEELAEQRLNELKEGLKEKSEGLDLSALRGFNAEFNIDLQPSFLVLPGGDHWAEEACNSLIVSTGHVKLDTVLKGKSTSNVAEVHGLVESRLYANGRVENMQLAITNLKRFTQDSTVESYILQPFNLDLHTSLNLDQNAVRLSADFGAIRVNISPNHVQVLLSILSNIGVEQITADEGKGTLAKFSASQLFKPAAIEAKKHWFLKNTSIASATEVTEETVLSPEDSPVRQTSTQVKDQIISTIKEITVVFESGGVASQPLLLFRASLELQFNDWKQAFLTNTFVINYYNERHIAWEPLLEPVEDRSGRSNPWSCELIVTLGEQTKALLQSDEQLELTVSKSCLNVLQALGDAFDKAYKTSKERTETDGFVRSFVKVRNFLGMDILIYANKSRYLFDQKTAATKLDPNWPDYDCLIIKTGQTFNLYQKESHKGDDDRSNLLVTIGYDGKEITRTVSLARTCRRVYDLPVPHFPWSKMRWSLDVKTVDINRKEVTFGSLVEIENNLNMDLHLFKFKPEEEQKVALLTELKSKQAYQLPLDLVSAQHPTVLVKPADANYCIPNDGVSWQNLAANETAMKQKAIFCESKSKMHPSIFLQAVALATPTIFEETAQKSAYTCKTSINPTLAVQNLLPIPIRCIVGHRGARGACMIPDSDPVHINTGKCEPLYQFDPQNSMIEIRIENFLKHHWTCQRMINIRKIDEDEVSMWKFCGEEPGTNQVNEQLNIHFAVSLMRSKTNHSVKIAIFASFWLVNKTGRDISWILSDLTIKQKPTTDIPLLFSYDGGHFSTNKLALSVNGSQHSDSFSIETVGNQGNVICKEKDGRQYAMSVSISLSSFSLTKIVTVRPFYAIVNRTALDLKISERQKKDGQWIALKGQSQQSFWPLRPDKGQLYLRTPNFTSQSIQYKQPNTSLVVLGEHLLYVLIDVNEHEVKIQINDYFPGSAPLRIFNHTDLEICYEQFGTNQRHHLPPHQSVYFVWPEPSSRRELIWKTSKSEETTIEPNQDAFGEVSEAAKLEEACFFWVTFLDGKQRTLVVTADPEITKTALQMGEITKLKIEFEMCIRGFGMSLVNDDLHKELIYLAITAADTSWEFRKSKTKRFKPLAIKNSTSLEQAYQRELRVRQLSDEPGPTKPKLVSLTDGAKVNLQNLDDIKMLEPQQGDLKRYSAPGLRMTVKMGEYTTQLGLKINRLQIDNQMSDCLFPIIMCPVKPPHSLAQDRAPKPFIELSALVQRMTAVSRVKYLSVLIQEFLIQIDGQFLTALADFSKRSNDHEYDFPKLIKEDLVNLIKEEDIGESYESKNYFDLIHFSPIKVHVSFSLGGANLIDISDVFNISFKSAGVTIPEFKDVLFKIEFFERKNRLFSNNEIVSEAISHYVTQALKQFYMIVLGLDVIGNPVGLVMGFTRGVGDLFYEPFLGIIEGPEEFAEGLALGVRSLFSHTLGGAAGALSKITGSLGQGVSALTMDDEYIARRRARLNQNTNIAQGGKELARGFFSGVTGIFTKPIQGAKKQGVEGFVKGLGKGAVGVIAQPATGVIDFASCSLGAFKKAIDIQAEARRLRPTRAFYPNNKLRPYNSREAQGAQMFTQVYKGAFLAIDQYVVHGWLNHPGNESTNMILMVTTKRIILIKTATVFKSLDVKWQQPFDNIEPDGINLVGNRIVITLIEKQQKFLGLVNQGRTKKIFCQSPEAAKWFYQQIVKACAET